VAVSLVSDSAGLDDFVRLPWRIYPTGSPWVPPLNSEVKDLVDPRRHHPFYAHAEVQLFVASREGRPVGRIAAILNHAHLDIHRDGVGFFGFFEAEDDDEVARSLFDAAAGWLRDRGATRMRGPVNPSVNEEIGLLLDDFAGRPVLMMTYNPPYYVRLLEGAGFAKVRELYAYLATENHRPTDKQERLGERLKRHHGIEIRNARLRDAEREASIIEGIYNEAWNELWGYVPMTHDEVVYMTKKLKPLADERMILIASVRGEPAAFALAIPDLNDVLRRLNGRLGPIGILKALYYRRKIRGLRLMALGVVREHRRKGIEALLVQELFKRGLAGGYRWMEISWVLEDNAAANNVLRNLGFPRYRTYGLFEKSIGPDATANGVPIATAETEPVAL
jgi:GNAT superfamily N-acetyltransferase